MIFYETKQGDMLDAICWKHYGTMSGTVETVLEANRSLDIGQFVTFPAGVKIRLPEMESVSAPEKTLTRLWDL